MKSIRLRKFMRKARRNRGKYMMYGIKQNKLRRIELILINSLNHFRERKEINYYKL